MTAMISSKSSVSARAHAHEHLDEVRARDAEERHAGFTCDGASEQCFAGLARFRHITRRSLSLCQV